TEASLAAPPRGSSRRARRQAGTAGSEPPRDAASSGSTALPAATILPARLATAAASSYTGSAARRWCHMRAWSCAHRDVVGDVLSAAYERFLHPPARAMQEGERRRFPPERPVLRGEGDGGVATEVAKNASSIGYVNLADARSNGGF